MKLKLFELVGVVQSNLDDQNDLGRKKVVPVIERVR